jgi:hypothetical protein
MAEKRAAGTFTFKPPTAKASAAAARPQKKGKSGATNDTTLNHDALFSSMGFTPAPVLGKSGTDSEQDVPVDYGGDEDDTSVVVVSGGTKQQQQQTTTAKTKKKKSTLEPATAPTAVPKTPPSTAAPATPAGAAGVESQLVARIVNELNDIVGRAVQPLLTFVGMVAVKLRENDVRNLLAWPDGPKGGATSMKERVQVVEPAQTMAEFIAKNRELGPTLLGMYINSNSLPPPMLTTTTTTINACFELDGLEEQVERADAVRRPNDDLDREIQQLEAQKQNASPFRLTEIDAAIRARNEAKILRSGIASLMGGDVELKFAPAWAFQVMGDAVFRRILSVSTLAAIEAAAAAVRRIPNCASYTVKELICSPQVSDQFAFLVSASYLSSGDGIPPAQRGAGRGGNRNSTYLNVLAMRQQLASKIYTCNVWFETGVARRPHPLRKAFSDQCAKKKQQMTGAGISAQEITAWETRMAAYLEAMPRYELVFTGDDSPF